MLTIPEGCEVELWLDAREKIKYSCLGELPNGLKKYKLTGGKMVLLKLKYT